MAAAYSVHLLHDREDLLEPTALLINDEWPRSLSARLLSISDGIDALPCSVILTKREGGGEEVVVGHAHLMPVAGTSGAAFVESVVVARKLRGCGLGRRMMEEAELHAAKMSYTSMHLSTHDKVGFYSHLGYVGGPKVSPLRKCVAKLSDEGTKSLIIGLETGSAATTETDSPTNHIDTTSSSVDTTTTAVDEAPPPAVVAPPPPPPPKLLKSSQFRETEKLTWMMKCLQTNSTLTTQK